MKSRVILPSLSILLLLASIVRLTTLDRQELRAYRVTRSEAVQASDAGSFAGVGAKGNIERVTIGGNGHLLLFVIHQQRAEKDVQFWNSVIRSVILNRQVPPASVQYWGICDAGAGCNGYQRNANFSILGFIDPWEMQIIAQADAKNEALLYNHHRVLKAHIACVSDAAVEADLVAQGAISK
jgi:hypothetical protein